MIELENAHTIRQMKGHTNTITCIVYCPELLVVVTGSTEKTAHVWNMATGECVHELRGHTSRVECAAVHGTTYVYCVLLIVGFNLKVLT